MKTPLRRTVAVAAVAVLALAGCGRDSGSGGTTGGGADGDVNTAGITDDPCPDAVNADNGCIYLGMITDLTGPFSPIGAPMVEGAQAFFTQINEAGGINGYDIDTSTVRDNEYNPSRHAQMYREIKDDILLISHSMGTAHTNGVLTDARDESIVMLPASLGSNWMFEDGIMHIGTSYCAEAMNVVDYAVDELDASSIGMVHFPGDYGDDSANGARIAAEARGIEFFDYTTGQGGVDEQTGPISGILRDQPDVVMLATSAIEVGAVVGATAAQGYRGQFVGAIPAWSVALLGNPQLAPALEAQYLHASSIGAWDADTPGHEEMRDYAASNNIEPNDWFALGWAGSHAVKQLLETAIDEDSLSREGVYETLGNMSGIESMGMLPEGDGNYSGEPNERGARSTFINGVDPDAATGIREVVPAFTGPTAEDYEFTDACYQLSN